MRGEWNDSPLTSGRVLGDRCRDLWLPMWVRPSPERPLVEPDDWGAAEAVLQAPRLRELVTAAFEAWPVTAPPPVTELARGCWLISVSGVDVDPEGGGQAETTAAAMVLGAEFLDTTLFGEVSRSAQLDPDEARTALAPLCRHRRAQAEEYARVLSWMAADLRATSEQRLALTNFSGQLVDMYEQMHLLYRIGELMNGLDDPSGFVRMACDLLHTTLEFEWISVRFTSFISLGPSMTNHLILVGKPPCSLTRYDELAGEVASATAADDRPAVLAPRGSELAALVRSEVFVNPLVCDEAVAGILLAGNKTGPECGISTVDMQLLSATADYLSAYLHNAALYHEQRVTFLGIIKALSASIDAKDRYTRGHSERVAHIGSQIAVAMGMSEEQTERVRLAGILHDLGKIGIREAVLLKPGRLTPDEYDEIKQHPTIGYNILKDIEPLHDILPGVLHHHERWDGGGYPHGLRGENIPLLGRILAVADAFDAMSSDRAYRPRMPREVVLREMQTGAGSQWDATLINIFQKLDLSRYDAMIHHHAAQTKDAA